MNGDSITVASELVLAVSQRDSGVNNFVRLNDGVN